MENTNLQSLLLLVFQQYFYCIIKILKIFNIIWIIKKFLLLNGDLQDTIIKTKITIIIITDKFVSIKN